MMPRPSSRGHACEGVSLHGFNQDRVVCPRREPLIRLLGLSGFDLAYATGRVSHEERMAMIELYGREVIPRVRELLENPPAQLSPSDTRSPAEAAAFHDER